MNRSSRYKESIKTPRLGGFNAFEEQDGESESSSIEDQFDRLNEEKERKNSLFMLDDKSGGLDVYEH